MASVDHGSERALVDSKDFKSFRRALDTPGVGSIPTRSRQFCRFLVLFLVPLVFIMNETGEVRAQDADSTESRVVSASVREEGPSIAWVTVRSGILPGWGQMVNRKPVKAVLFFGAYTGFAVSAIMAESDRRDAQSLIDDGSVDPALVEDVNDAVNKRNFGMWMMGATMVFSMLDAYVDAHFFHYDEQWRAGPVFDDGLVAVSMGYRF